MLRMTYVVCASRRIALRKPLVPTQPSMGKTALEEMNAPTSLQGMVGGAVAPVDDASKPGAFSPTGGVPAANRSFRKTREKARPALPQRLSGSHNPLPRPKQTVQLIDPRSSFDLGTTLVVNSKTNEILLNQAQEDALFEARSDLYRKSLRKIVVVLQAHLSPLEKCHRLLLLHDQLVVQNRLRLRADTYEEIFHTFYGVAMLGVSSGERLPESNPNSLVGSSATAVQHSNRRGASTQDDDELMADIHTQTSPFLHPVWAMYRYMVDSGTNPTPRVVQHVMGLLGRVRQANVDVEARAHSLAMDCDRCRFPMTEYTLVDYCRVCSVNGAMHLAMARVTDYMTRHQKPPSAGVATTLLNGLTANGHHKEALTFIGTLQNVAITLPLLHATLQAGRYSADPASAFAFYESLKGSGIRPSHHTIGILVEVVRAVVKQRKLDHNELDANARSMSESRHEGSHIRLEASMDWLRNVVSNVIIKDMLKYKVRMNHRVLNRLLACLVDVGHRRAFGALCGVMVQRHGVRSVFTELYPAEWVAEAMSRVHAKKAVAPSTRRPPRHAPGIEV